MTGTAARITEALAGRYRIEEEIGAGGMATVYLANDEKHDRQVAVKVLRPEWAAALGPERFLREIKITAQLQHPHILTLIDSGEADGFLYYVMPFVDGESLRERLNRERQLSMDDALSITREVADALAYAQAHDVVHRDIKPENILLSGGHAAVTDFGIAKAVSTAGGDRLTETGLSLGTPAYMSPEQAAGDAELDGRTDVYSLACVLYEMLAGEPPYTGPNAQAILAKQLTEPIPKLSTLRDTVPPAVEQAVTKALARVPVDRFANMGEFAAALTAQAVAPAVGQVGITMPVSSAPDRTPFIGRDDEREELLGRVEQLQQGRGGLVLISGEPGVGKTRLAETVLEEARQVGTMCLVGRCYEMEGAPPFNPFLEQLESLVRMVPTQALREALGGAAAEIARIMPGLRETFSDIPPPVELPPDQQRRYLFTKYREFLERTCRIGPMVVLFDDLHWADESSLLLLEHLANHLHGLPVLAIGTYRDVELEVTRPFAKTLESLTRQRLARRIALRRLPEEQVGDLLAALGGAAPPSELVRVIFHETEGNPFFVEEVFQHLSEEGRLFDDESNWRSDLSIDELDVPEGVRLVIGRRLERLSDDARAVLTSAAVIGHKFALGVLEALDEVHGDALLDALEEAERAKLIVEQAQGRETAYAFAHELIRATLVGALSMPRRQRRHRHMAEAMERLYADRIEQHASDLAYHLYQAGSGADEEKTLRFLMLAGDQALDQAAFDEALAHIGRALSIEEDPEPQQHAEFLRKRGAALRGLGRWTDAMQQWQEVLPLFESLEDAVGVAGVCLDMGYYLWWQLDVGVLDVVDRGMRAIGPTPCVERSRLLAMQGLAIAVFGGEYDKGKLAMHEARRMGEQIGDQSVAGSALGSELVLALNYMRFAEGVALRPEAERILRAANDQSQLCQMLSSVEHALMCMGRLDEALALGNEVAPVADELGHVGALVRHDYSLNIARWCRHGDLDEWEAYARRSRDSWSRIGPSWGLWADWLLGGVSFCRGDWEEAVKITASFVQEYPENYMAGVLWGGLFVLQAYVGREDALATFERRRETLPRPGQPPLLGSRLFAIQAVEGLAVLGERREAAALYFAAKDSVDDGCLMWGTGLTERRAGIAAACGEQWEVAEQHFEASLQQVHEIPFRVEQPEVRRWYAWMLLDRNQAGDKEKATTLLNEAIEMYKEIGMPRHVELAEELLGR